MGKRLWVFDLDGTLMDTMFLYGYSYLDAARLILDDIGGAAPHVSVLVNHIKQKNDALVGAINPATGTPFSYDKRRFPTALQGAYEEVCAALGREPRESVLEKLWKTGEKVFDPSRYPGIIKPETAPLLRQIGRAGDGVVILTKGDSTVQGEKLAALTAAGVPFIASIIVENAKDAQFAKLQENNRREFEQFVAIGDTYDADIAPARALGYHGIWLAVESWQQIGQMEKLRTRAQADGVTIVGHLRDLFPMTEGPLV